ncbi:MAG: ABC transporter permease subunit [Lachnospiraceae bacterium]|nr:ABC transporter permease subunit [Lachnospiraceae bacterium]
MKKSKNIELKIIFIGILLFFLTFFLLPLLSVIQKSVVDSEGVTLSHFAEVLQGGSFLQALGNSLLISAFSAVVTTVLAFILAYSIQYTNMNGTLKKFIRTATILPMFLPTITYGFAIIYSFGKEGLLTKLFGRQLFHLYGFNGLLLGYVIYTLPISFMLLQNTMHYIDKKFTVVSRIMGDSVIRCFFTSVVRPMLGTFAASFIQCFFLCFTDFGIPASVGGKFEVVAGVLYNEMLGSIPDFNNGAVVAIIMLLPSVVSITMLKILEKYNIRYNKVSEIELKKSKLRDMGFSVLSIVILTCILSVFAVIFVIPFVEEWPYRTTFTMAHIRQVLSDSALLSVYGNSIYVSILTAVIGSAVVYGAALITARSTLSVKCKQIIEGIALVTNTIPGMVLGIAFMLSFKGTPIQNGFIIIIVCNLVHFFSTPYLMMKSSLEKMNVSWETTARLMGDSWFKTIVRVVTPNAYTTILEIFSYYFVNAMVTISAIIFIAGAKTMVITTKIKELQYYNKFNDVFVLSLLILLTNIVVKGMIQFLANRKSNNKTKKEES